MKKFIAFAVGILLLTAAFWGTIGYVLVHFLKKLW